MNTGQSEHSDAKAVPFPLSLPGLAAPLAPMSPGLTKNERSSAISPIPTPQPAW